MFGLLQVLALVPFCMLVSDGTAGRMWHRTVLYVIQMIASGVCVGLAVYVLYGDGAASMTHEPIDTAEKGTGGKAGQEGAAEESPWERVQALFKLFTKK